MKHILRAVQDRIVGSRRRHDDINLALDEAAAWLARAQDAGSDDGVAAWYDLRKKAWEASYPETTGYIIPTFYDYADFAEKPEFKDRAYRMAVWEVEIQLPEGGVRAGTLSAAKAAPTIFNTGQVLLGWARAYRETGEERFKQALIKAADWLVAAQDEDGAWRRFSSPFTSNKLNSYNTRVAFGLARASEALGEARYLDAAKRNVRWVLNRARSNAWLEDNCLDRPDFALTHTIAYSIRGILEVGVAASEDRMVEFAARMAKAVAGAQREDGAMPGRLDPSWTSDLRWSCLTGNAQMAINWLRLADRTGEKDYISAARRANRFNMSTQDIKARSREVRGAIKGSHPIDGGYMTFRYPNWAAKFFMDALMLEKSRPTVG